MPNRKRTRERQLAKLAARRAAERRKKRNQRLAALSVGVIVAVAGLGFLGVALFGGDEPDPSASPTATPSPSTTPAEPVTVTSEDGSVSCTYLPDTAPPADSPPLPDFVIDLDLAYKARIQTSMGSFEVQLLADSAPCTVNSFVHLAEAGYFDSVIFHRVAQEPPVIQGGDPTGTGSGGPGYSFADELGTDLAYLRGTVAMANAGPNTNGSQFFVMTADYEFPPSYSIFGNVVEGMDVVEAIHGVAVEGETPVEDVVIQRVTITLSLPSPSPSASPAASPSASAPSPSATPSAEPSASPTEEPSVSPSPSAS